MATTVLDSFITEFRFVSTGSEQVRREVQTIGQQIDRTAVAMGRAAIMWGMAFGFIGKAVVDLDKKIIGIATQARISTDAMRDHYDVIRKIGKAYSVTGKEMLEAFESVVELTGDAELALQNSPLMAKMIRGGKMKPVDAGSLISAFRDLKVPAEQFGELADALTFISKKGSIPIHNIGSLIPRAGGLFSATGYQGTVGVKKMMIDLAAALQIGNRIMRSPKRSVTAIENFINDYSAKLDEINALTGETFTGNEGIVAIMGSLMKTFAEADDMEGLAGIFDVKKSDLKSATNVLSLADDIFGRRGRRQFAAMNLGFDDMNELINAANESLGTLDRDSGRYTDTTVGKAAKATISIEGMVKAISKSGGMLEVLSALEAALNVISFILTRMPSGFLEFIILSIFFNKVVLGLLVNALRPLYLFIIGKLIPAFGIMQAGIGGGIGVVKAFTIAWQEMNLAMKANIILSIIYLLISAFLVLRALWNRFFSKKHKLDVEMPDMSKLGVGTADLRVASAVSPSVARGGSVVTQNNTVHVEGNVDQENVDRIAYEMQNQYANANDYFGGI